MTLIPDKLFVNLYLPGVGGSIGTAFPTRQKADEAATSHRLACLETGARPANSIALADESYRALAAAAKERETEPERMVVQALNILIALPRETRTAINAYAAQHNIKPYTAIAEACRAYFVGDKAA